MRSGLRSWCKTCSEAATQRWREANAEKIRVQSRERNRRWRQRRRPTEATRRIKRHYQAARRARTPSSDAETAEYSLILLDDPCGFCGKRGQVHLDHIDPLARSGAHHWSNLTALCGPCNSGKRDKPLLAALL